MHQQKKGNINLKIPSTKNRKIRMNLSPNKKTYQLKFKICQLFFVADISFF